MCVYVKMSKGVGMVIRKRVVTKTRDGTGQRRDETVRAGCLRALGMDESLLYAATSPQFVAGESV